MYWMDFLKRFAGRPLFHASMLSIFYDSPQLRQVQLTRWTKAGKLDQVRRGWYLIRPPWRSREVSRPYIANQVVHPSYLSLEWALQYYDMIPEYVPNPTLITTERAIRLQAVNSLFIYHHVKPAIFSGYIQVELEGLKLNIAYPEKALFDKIYIFLQDQSFSVEWLESLRLQNLEDFDFERFQSYLEHVKKKNIKKSLEASLEYLEELQGENP